MAPPSATPLEDDTPQGSPLPESYETRPVKRQKIESLPIADDEEPSNGNTASVKRHPLAVRPAGNAFTASTDLRHASGLFARLPEELLGSFLETLEAPDLLRLGGTCRALHAYTRNEELWRTLFVASPPPSFSWRGTWRSTYLSQPSTREPAIDCTNLFSDLLHRPFFCAHVPLDHYALNIPNANQIPRFHDLTPSEFAARWVSHPFILTHPVRTWPIFHTWSWTYLAHTYPSTLFRAEAVDWPLSTYLNYLNDSHDESPLYLFDSHFASKMSLPPTAYTAPPCFGADAFTHLGPQRPDHKWLIIGPSRSGSTFHKDPNATSAWNAVLRGRKYWIMFPSSPSIPPPPGVFVSEDQSEVTAPLSIPEWLLGFHAEARKTPGCKEGICEEGEVLYVPSGWYHLVLNLEDSVAVTQNFVPEARLGAVLAFLRDQRQSVSGFAKGVGEPFELFVDKLGEAEPELLERGLAEMERLRESRVGKWERLTAKSEEGEEGEGEGEGGFSFGFGGGDSDEEVP
ncbi:hypothetical protein MBLNU230_g3785t1 [Neophaeotheca triangularis]